MSDFPLPPGFTLEKPVKPPEGFEIEARKSIGEQATDAGLIFTGGMVKGAREGANPLGLAETLLRLGTATLPFTHNTGAQALRETGAGDLLAGIADWLTRNKPLTDPLTVAETMGAPVPPPELRSPEAVAKLRNVKMGAPERIAGKVGEVFGQTIPLAPLGMTAPLRALATTAFSGLGAGAGREVGGPIGEIIGGLLPLAAPAAAGTIRGVLGAGSEKMREAISAFERAGTAPTLGQATGSKGLSAIESGLGRYGGIGVMQRKGELQAAQMGAKAEDLASGMAPKMEDALAGQKVLEGLTGKGGFVERSKIKADKLYADVDKAIPANTPITMANTLAYMTERTKINPLAPATTAEFNKEAIGRLGPKLEALLSDMRMNRGALPYAAVKDMRTAVGQKIDDALLTGDLTQKEARALYSSITKDVESSLRAMPSPVYAATANPAIRAWERATGFYQARMDRIESVIAPLAAKTEVGQILPTLERNAHQGSTLLGRTLRSLAPADRDVAAAWFTRRMGEATPANQLAEGGATFSPAIFLQRYGRLDDRAKAMLFDGAGNRDLRTGLDALYKASQRIKKGSQVLANPSGTAAAQYGLYQWLGVGGTGGVVGSIVSGSLDPAIAVGASMAISNGLARLMTSPKAVRWLARSTTMEPFTWAQQGQRIATEIGDPDVREAIGVILGKPQDR